MTYRLHCVGASGNSYKVALYLNCAGLSWEPVGVDFAGGETRDPAWRAQTNGMGEVPVLEADGRQMTQSGAILMWLAETHGQFAPAADEKFETMRWLLFDNHKFTSNYAQHRILLSMMPEPAHPSTLAYLRARVDSAFSIVEGTSPTGPSSSASGRRSSTSRWRATSTIRSRRRGSTSRRIPALDRWRQRLAALPGWKPPYEMMPVGSSMPVRRPYTAAASCT